MVPLPAILAASSIVTGEPHPETVVAQSSCDVWNVPFRIFSDCFRELSAGVTASVVEKAFLPRVAKLRVSVVISAATLRSTDLFSTCPEYLLEELARNCVPRCWRQHSVLFASGRCPSFMYLLICGTVAGYRGVETQTVTKSFEITASSPWTHDGGSEGPQAPRDVRLLGAEELLEGKPTALQYRCESRCDGFLIPHSAVQTALHLLPHDHFQVILRAKRATVVGQSAGLADRASSFPFLGSRLSAAAASEMMAMFVPNVYKSMTIICSTSENCDRVLLLLKGSAQVDTCEWKVGEFIGYSCVLSHRWSRSVIARETVEVLELPRLQFIKFLHGKKLFGEYEMFIRCLATPDRFHVDAVRRARKQLQGLVTPWLFRDSGSFVEGVPAAVVQAAESEGPCPSAAAVPFRGMDRVSSTTWIRKF